MDNSGSLDVVNSAIVDCEAEVEKLDQLTAHAAMSQEAIAKLEGDIADIHFNRANLEPKVRATRLTTSTSMLALERADLATFNGQIDSQSNRVVAYSRRAVSLLQQVQSAVLAARKKSVETMFEATFDLRRLNSFATEFSHVAFTVLEVVELGNTISQHRHLPSERILAVFDARKLRERAAPLLTMAANELDEPLNLITSEVGPIAEAKPAVIGNQLGTLAQAVAA